MAREKSRAKIDRQPKSGQVSAVSHRRTIASTLLYIEAGILFSLAVFQSYLGLTHEQKEMGPLIGVIVFALLGALGLFACGRGVKGGKRYGNSPALLANLIALGVAYYQIQGAFYIGAMIILLLAIPTIYFIFSIVNQEG